MNDKEKIQNIFERFYNRDEETKKVQKEFLENKNSYSELLENTLRAICEIEKQLNISLSEQYKEFLKAGIGNYIYNPDSIDEFRAYDARELYEFNYIGEKIGYSAIEELKDFLIVGQDTGECSYFFDPFNKLGYGIDAVWRINRCSCDKRNFELVAKDFYELAEKFCDKKDEDFERPFKNEKPVYEGTPIKDILEKQVENNSSLVEKINEMQNRIEQYFSLMKNKNVRGKIKRIRYSDIDEQRNFRLPTTYNLPLEVLYIIQKSFYFVAIKDFIITSLCDESLIERNYGKYSLKILKDMFVFASSDSSRFVEKPIDAMDYFFVDPTNILGNGSEAVYLIYTKAKELEEACHVAKDIVDLFRLFAEGAELNTTPIGRIK